MVGPYETMELKDLSLKDLLTVTVREDTAKELLVTYPTLRDIYNAPVDELRQVSGMGEATALRLKASLELGRRLFTCALGERPTISSPADAAQYLYPILLHHEREQFVVIFLSTKNQVTGHEVVSIGSLNSTIVHPREVFKNAIKRCAASIILAHNHPSGIEAPSPDDRELTNRLVDVGGLIGISVVDHIIIGSVGRYCSLREKGLMRNVSNSASKTA